MRCNRPLVERVFCWTATHAVSNKPRRLAGDIFLKKKVVNFFLTQKVRSWGIVSNSRENQQPERRKMVTIFTCRSPSCSVTKMVISWTPLWSSKSTMPCSLVPVNDSLACCCNLDSTRISGCFVLACSLRVRPNRPLFQQRLFYTAECSFGHRLPDNTILHFYKVSNNVHSQNVLLVVGFIRSLADLTTPSSTHPSKKGWTM